MRLDGVVDGDFYMLAGEGRLVDLRLVEAPSFRSGVILARYRTDVSSS